MSVKGRLKVGKRQETPELFTETAILATEKTGSPASDRTSISFTFSPTNSKEPGRFFHNKRKYRFGHSRGGEAAPSLVSEFSTPDPQVRPSARNRAGLEVRETVVGALPRRWARDG